MNPLPSLKDTSKENALLTGQRALWLTALKKPKQEYLKPENIMLLSVLPEKGKDGIRNMEKNGMA